MGKFINRYTVGALALFVLPWIFRIVISSGQVSGMTEVARQILDAHAFAVYAGSWVFSLILALIGIRKKWSPFKIEYVEGWGPFSEVTDEATENGIMREWTYRVKITARWWPVCNVSALINNLTPQPNALYARPVALRFTNDAYQTSLLKVLDKGQSEFINVLRCRAMLGSAGYYLMVDHCTGGGREIPLQEYHFDMDITGDDVDPLHRHFAVWLDCNGRPNLSANNFIYRIKRRMGFLGQ